ncbi:MAG: CPBP family intramembrane metalloprotease [Candidatus Melainabacteria bacterium]|nr:CPBP family intramembrane metalloprotease [Candidatus Melainabacteria bacterium]
MSDFIIVFAVAILGLLAQAAGGKRARRLVPVPASPVARTETAAQQEIRSSATAVSDSAVGEIRPNPETAEVTSELEPADEIKSEVVKAKSETEAKSEEAKSESEAKSEEAKSESEAKSEEVKSESESEAKSEEVKSESESEAKSEEVKSESESEAKSEEVKSESESEAKSEEVKSDYGLSAAHEAVASKEVKVESEPVFLETPPAISTVPGPTPELVAAAVSTPPVLREEFYMTRKPGIEYFLRITIFLWFIGLSIYYYISSSGLAPTELITPDPWVMQVTFVTCALTGLGLVKGFRTILSYVLSAVDCVFDVKLLKAAAKNWTSVKPIFAADRVFVPSSIPHMVGLFIYVQTMFYLLAAMAPKTDFQMPGMPIPLPLPLDQLFSYNGLGLVMLAFCGCGILVTRQFKEVMQRLALVQPTAPQIMLGLGLVFMSFMYDYVWSLYTHGQHLGLDIKLEGYNGGTFTAGGGFTGAIVLALATAIFAGVGEETLIRGALQPVFGLVPAAILHGVLHAQFQHAPIFIVQVAGWSILMGIAKRYTNTTTTIIGHAGFNFVTSFLFAFNPPDF